MRKPFTGTILGLILGLAVAVVLQQQGVWPLDKITVFLLPAVGGLIGLLILSIGKEGSVVTMVISLIIIVPLAAFGATDLGTTNEAGQLNGGCKVQAESNLDQTMVTDTSKRAPFLIDPQGSLNWVATSPAPIEDHIWEMWVEIGATAVPFDSGGHPNDGKSTGNFGDVANVTAYAEGRGIPIDQLRGVFMVGGSINGTSSCDGFAFVKFVSGFLETLIAQIAAAIVVLIIIIFIIILIVSRRAASAAAAAVASAGSGGSAGGGSGGDQTIADDIVSGAVAGGYASETSESLTPGDYDGDGDIDLDDMTQGMIDKAEDDNPA